jgi:hypothetical protein
MSLADKLALATFVLNFVGFIGGGLVFIFYATSAFNRLQDVAKEALRQGVSAHKRMDEIIMPELNRAMNHIARLDERTQTLVPGSHQHQPVERPHGS